MAAGQCTRAQGYGGGVIVMEKGNVLFDAVAISDTEASVRAGWFDDASRADARGGRVSAADGVRANARGCGPMRRAC